MSPARKNLKKSAGSMPCTCNFVGIQTLRYTQRNTKKVYLGKCLSKFKLEYIMVQCDSVPLTMW